jgi:superfamily II DNA or RNA helicase
MEDRDATIEEVRKAVSESIEKRELYTLLEQYDKGEYKPSNNSNIIWQNTKIVDNEFKKLIDVLKVEIKNSKEAKFAIGYFFLTGFNLVKDDFPITITKRPFLRIVMGNETTYPTKEELTIGYKLRELYKARMLEELQAIELTDDKIDRLIALRDLIAEGIIDVRLYDKERLHAKLYLFITNPTAKYESKGLAIVGSSNFTYEGLTKNKELNILITDKTDIDYLDEWFERLWAEADDFRDDLLKVIEISGAMQKAKTYIPGIKIQYPIFGYYIEPELLFKYLVYRWFDGRILGLIRKDILLEFQVIGVLNAVNILNYYNGVIIADSVGLGKSYIASAIIEEFINKKYRYWFPEGKEPSVLLILPPSIIRQWVELIIESGIFLNNYKKKCRRDQPNYKEYELIAQNNEIACKIKFLSIGLFQNMNEDELKKLADDYDLILIDEAHKYRNRNTKRWKNARLLRYKCDGFNNKFILLTATPLNNSIVDIYNLISIFSDDAFIRFVNKGVSVYRLIEEYTSLKKKYKETNDKSIMESLLKKAEELKTKVLNEVMVLRTRKYIKDEFKDLTINGKPLIFRDPRPYSIEYNTFSTNKYRELIKLIGERLDKINFEYTRLYGVKFIAFKDTIKECRDQKRDDSNENNEEQEILYIEVAELFKLLLGKRLESNIYSFETTLRRMYEKMNIFYNIINREYNNITNEDKLRQIIEDAMRESKVVEDIDEVSSEFDLDKDTDKSWFEKAKNMMIEYTSEYLQSNTNHAKYYRDNIKSFDILMSGLKVLLDRIRDDINNMNEILHKLDELKDKDNLGKPLSLGKLPKEGDILNNIDIYVYGNNDPKLELLKQLLYEPTKRTPYLNDTPPLFNKKVLIFTQYKDTAYYIYNNLKEWIKKEPLLHRWLKYSNDNGSNLKIGLVTGDTDIHAKNNYIKRFAPIANRDSINSKLTYLEDEINILISTDVLSEGVNLQDADVVINYDLPWNPMIIVQRVGRVNRIGNDKDVIVINYLPSNDELDIIVRVLQKLKEKIDDITLIIGKDVRILQPDEEIKIETFGMKIKRLSEESITELEEYGLSEDFKEFISTSIPKEQLDEFRLLNIIQYQLNYTSDDFKGVENMIKKNKDKQLPYYTYISKENNEKFISIYEFYRGPYKIDKKIFYIDTNNKDNIRTNTATPIIFLDLINMKKKSIDKIDDAVNYLKEFADECKKIEEEMKELQIKQSGFLLDLHNTLLKERSRIRNTDKRLEDKYYNCLNILRFLPKKYSKEIKGLLLRDDLISGQEEEIKIKDLERLIDVLHNYFVNHGMSISAFDAKIEHIGWYYEV